MENIIETQHGTMVFNGGNPIENYPKSDVEFCSWINKANKEKRRFTEPWWGADCGFKADLEGPIIRINSRF